MKVVINITAACNLCRSCVELCPTGVFRVENSRIACDEGKCIYCRGCEVICPQKAIKIKLDLDTLKHKEVVKTITGLGDKHF